MKRTAISLAMLGLAGLVLAASAQEGNPLGERLQRFDSNGDGKLSMDEVAVYPPLEERLKGADQNGDGLLTIEEIRAHLQQQAPQPSVEEADRVATQDVDEDSAATSSTASPSLRGSARVVEGEFSSDLIPEAMKYAVLLPPGYDESDERYAILYDVYPAGPMGYRMIRKAESLVGELWNEGRMPGVLVVVPSIDLSLYMDPSGAGRTWEELLVGPFVDHLREEFRVIKDRQCLYATGLSAGGAISLRLGLKHPDVFGGIAVLAPGIEAAASLDDLDFEDTFWRPQNAYDTVDPEVWAAYHPLNIAKANADAIRAHELGIYLESGDEDSFMLHRGTDAMHRLLWDLGIPHEYHLRRGVEHHVGPSMPDRWKDAYAFLGSQIEPRTLEPIEVKLKEIIAQMREQAAKGIPNDPELVRLRMQLVRLRQSMQRGE
jgi:S-formylglutathione hydrolase